MRIAAYVDGFNVYYNCFRGPRNASNTDLKWLDYRALFDAMFPGHEITIVRIYTAIVSNPHDDPGQAMRHDAYLRALDTVPGVEVYRGRFRRAKRDAVLARPPEGVDPSQVVYVYQEKKSDVSLASHLLMDTLDDRFDRAVLLTNDTDFVVPVELVRVRYGREVIIVSPDRAVNKELKKAASAGWVLDRGLLAKCQLPDPVVDSEGRSIHKPEKWRIPVDPTSSLTLLSPTRPACGHR